MHKELRGSVSSNKNVPRGGGETTGKVSSNRASEKGLDEIDPLSVLGAKKVMGKRRKRLLVFPPK